MELRRWKLINALKGPLLGLLGIYAFAIFMVTYWGKMIYPLFQKAMETGNWDRLFEKGGFLLFFSVMVVLIAFSMIYTVQMKGLIWDILFGEVEVLEDIHRRQLRFPVVTDSSDWKYAKNYWLRIEQNGPGKPISLFVAKAYCDIQKGVKYRLYYLKHAKVLVGAEVIMAKETKEVPQKTVMTTPRTLELTRSEIWKLTKPHRWRSIFLSLYCLAGLIALVGWGIYSMRSYTYWYVLEAERCRGIWTGLLLLELVVIALFYYVDRGLLWDICTGGIGVSEIIEADQIYGKRLWTGVDKRFRDRILAVDFKVIAGAHKGKRFLLYKEISKYWNCFPMNVRMGAKYRGERFEKGTYSVKAVRFYYLKKSGFVVKVDAQL